MPNTSSAKKAHRNSVKKQAMNQEKKSNITNALRDFRKALATKPAEFQATLSKAFSSLDKAVKTNFIPKGRADRKKAKLSAMAVKANGGTVAAKVVGAKTAAKKAAPKKVVVKKAVVAKAPSKVVAKPAVKATVKKPVAKK
jgi:ribosomal protein S20